MRLPDFLCVFLRRVAGRPGQQRRHPADTADALATMAGARAKTCRRNWGRRTAGLSSTIRIPSYPPLRPLLAGIVNHHSSLGNTFAAILVGMGLICMVMNGGTGTDRILHPVVPAQRDFQLSLVNQDKLLGARGMRTADRHRAGRQFQIQQFKIPVPHCLKNRVEQKPSPVTAQRRHVRLMNHCNILFRLLDQRGEGHMQPCGDFPQGGNGRA